MNQKPSDTSKWDGVVSELKREAEARVESSPEVPPTMSASAMGDVERLASRLVAFPYEKIARSTGYEPWRLDPDEAMINGILVKNIVIYYLPFINLGKLSLWAFVGFNVIVVATKSLEYRSYLKQQEEAKKPKDEAVKGTPEGVTPIEEVIRKNQEAITKGGTNEGQTKTVEGQDRPSNKNKTVRRNRRTR